MTDEDILDSIRRGNHFASEIQSDIGRTLQYTGHRLSMLTKYGFVKRTKYRISKTNKMKPLDFDIGSFKYYYELVEENPSQSQSFEDGTECS